MTAAASAGDATEKSRNREEKGLSTVPKVTQGLVANVFAAVRALRQLPDCVLPGTWIGPNREPLPTQRNVLALDNCLLDLDTGERLDHTPNWFSLAALPVRYDPHAPPPAKFMRVLGELMLNDQSLIDVVWEAFGACLDPNLMFKYTVALVGDGDSGKTVIVIALMTLLGKGNYSTTSMVRLTQRFGAYALFGKLANVVDDESGAELSDEAVFRRFTGGAPIDYEQKGQDVFSGTMTAKLIFSTNRLPRFDDEIDANYNRLAAIPCRYVVPADKQAPGMRTPEYWAGELSGILNMALEGRRRLIRQGNRLTASPAMAGTVARHRRETNHVRWFLEEHYQLDPNGSVQTDRLYTHYGSWCETSGIQDRDKLDKIKFGLHVKKVFKASTSSTVRVEGGESTRWRFGIAKKPTS
jgi:putative DNA primase/helicase